MTDISFLEFNDATIEDKNQMVPIKLKLTGEGIEYKSKSDKIKKIEVNDISLINWQRLAGGYGIRIFTDDGRLFRFGSFKESDQGKLEKFFKNVYSKTMTEKEFSVKGWNFGSTKFEGDVLSFDVASVPSFEIPIRYVRGCTTGKNEVTLEFHQNDDAAASLMEMRLYIPPSELAGEDPVDNFQQKILQKASVVTVTGDALATFSQIHCLTPRGRYDFKVYPTFIQLHGKTFDFKIPIESVLRLFLLPHVDGRQHYFVVSLDPPIKQGQTRYPYLILQFFNDENDTVEIPLSEEELKESFDGRLEKEYEGPQFEVMSRLFKALCNRKIVTPGNFEGKNGAPAIPCSYKAAAGFLYPLERGLMYVHKPPVHIRFEEVSSINFGRSGTTTKYFDLEVKLKNGSLYTFSSIPKDEYDKLHKFIKNKNISIKDSGKVGHISHKMTDRMVENDPYINRVQAEALEREEDDDDESSEDSDFNPDKEQASDVAEEYDSSAKSSSEEEDSEADSPKKKPESKKSEKKKKKPEKKAEKKKPAKKSIEPDNKKASPTKGGSGSGFKSKEFIEDSDSSSDDEKKSKDKSKKSSPKKKKDSDEEMVSKSDSN